MFSTRTLKYDHPALNLPTEPSLCSKAQKTGSPGLFSMNRLLNGPNANAKITGNPFDAPSLCPRGMDRSQGLTGDSGATDGLSALGAVLPGPCEACVDPLPDHGAFEFGKYAIIWNRALPPGVVVSTPCRSR